jgi:hypothetical protein
MSLFFFHVRDGSTTFDGDGVEFPDVEAARREAIVACGELLREVPAAIWNGDSVRLWVTSAGWSRQYSVQPEHLARRQVAFAPATSSFAQKAKGHGGRAIERARRISFVTPSALTADTR